MLDVDKLQKNPKKKKKYLLYEIVEYSFGPLMKIMTSDVFRI